MRADELKQLLDRRPFQPIRLHISSGEHADVIHPEAAMLGRSLIVVALKRRAGIVHQFAWYNLLHVVKISPLRAARKARRRRRA